VPSARSPARTVDGNETHKSDPTVDLEPCGEPWDTLRPEVGNANLELSGASFEPLNRQQQGLQGRTLGLEETKSCRDTKIGEVDGYWEHCCRDRLIT
jgi:hypothetical protein